MHQRGLLGIPYVLLSSLDFPSVLHILSFADRWAFYSHLRNQVLRKKLYDGRRIGEWRSLKRLLSMRRMRWRIMSICISSGCRSAKALAGVAFHKYKCLGIVVYLGIKSESHENILQGIVGFVSLYHLLRFTLSGGIRENNERSAQKRRVITCSRISLRRFETNFHMRAA